VSAVKKADDGQAPGGPPKLFDVAKPGNTAAQPTSRPIIVNHGGRVKQDPMVNTAKAEEEPAKEPFAHSIGVNIKPLEKDESSGDDTQPEAETPPEPEQSAETKPEPEKDTQSAASGVVATIASEASTKSEQRREEQEADKKKHELEKLITSKKYFLPIHSGAGKDGGAGIMLLVILIFVAGFVLAVDAEFLDVNITLPFDLL